MCAAEPPAAPAGGAPETPAAPAAAPLSFQERFEALRREWRAQLPGKLRELQARLAACQDAPADTERLRELHRMLHTLAGSAGTFGVEALGRQAKAIEHALAPLLEQPERSRADFDGPAASLQALVDGAPQD